MIQRIQSIYLLFVVLLSGVGFYLPTATLSVSRNTNYLVSYKGIYLEQATEQVFQSPVWGVTVFALIIPIVALITVFLFKSRKLQIKLTYINIACVVMYYASVAAYIITAAQRLQAESIFHFGVVIPFVCLILLVLAVSAIKKDEALVKSLDRLR